MSELRRISRRTRATEKLVEGVSSNPIGLHGENAEAIAAGCSAETNAPPRMGTNWPSSMPILRLKKGMTSWDWRNPRTRFPNWKILEFSRKNSRFSGKKDSESSQIDLLLVRFNLSKVRVDGQIQGQSRRESVLDVKTHLGQEINIISFATLNGSREVGFNIKITPLTHPANALQLARQ